MSRTHLASHVKTSRAFRAYIDLMDTADWLRGQMSRQLASFDLTMMQFRVLDLLENWGAVRRDHCRLPSEKTDHVAKGFKKGSGKNWRGRRIVLVTLTVVGKKLIAHIITKHKKVVKAEMRVLDAREQQSLSRLCRKLRRGDPIKFIKEIRMVDREEEDWEE